MNWMWVGRPPFDRVELPCHPYLPPRLVKRSSRRHAPSLRAVAVGGGPLAAAAVVKRSGWRGGRAAACVRARGLVGSAPGRDAIEEGSKTRAGRRHRWRQGLLRHEMVVAWGLLRGCWLWLAGWLAGWLIGIGLARLGLLVCLCVWGEGSGVDVRVRGASGRKSARGELPKLARRASTRPPHITHH